MHPVLLIGGALFVAGSFGFKAIGSGVEDLGQGVNEAGSGVLKIAIAAGAVYGTLKYTGVIK